MSEQLLNVFKICLLAVLYLFFARVLRAVWAELKEPKPAVVPGSVPAGPVPAPVPAPKQPARSHLVVVAPDGGGPATYVEHARTGFLTETADVDRLAAATAAAMDASLVETDDDRARRSRETVETRFTIGRMARTLAAVYTAAAADEVDARSALAAAG